MTTADLDALADEAGRLAPGDAGAAAADPVAAAPAELAAPVDLAQSNTDALCAVAAMFREAVSGSELIFSPPLRTPAVHLADDKLPRLVRPWADYAAGRGWDFGAMLALDSPLVRCLLITGAPLWAFVQALTAELRERATLRKTPPAEVVPTPAT